VWASKLPRYYGCYTDHYPDSSADEHHRKALLARNAKVYIAARSQLEAKAEAAIEQLRHLAGESGIFLQLDLASLKSVKAAAEEFLR
jgi:NAD(P)-dependent dehydrogenase (short-subunit alcohol dehydrogenase family)